MLSSSWKLVSLVPVCRALILFALSFPTILSGDFRGTFGPPVSDNYPPPLKLKTLSQSINAIRCLERKHTHLKLNGVWLNFRTSKSDPTLLRLTGMSHYTFLQLDYLTSNRKFPSPSPISSCSLSCSKSISLLTKCYITRYTYSGLV